MAKRFGLCLAVLMIACTAAQADTIIYMTDQPPSPPSNLEKLHVPADIGMQSFFDVFVAADVHIGGIALDVFESGPAIDITDIQIHQASGPRWGGITDGVASGVGDSSVIGAFTIATPGFGSNGMNPAAPDDRYVPAPVGAFDFARVTYNIVGAGTSQIFLQIGDNEIALLDPTLLRLGVGDDPVDPFAGARSTGVDGTISVVPEPASLALVGLAMLSLVGLVRRHR
jgi:hypothetical protein